MHFSFRKLLYNRLKMPRRKMARKKMIIPVDLHTEVLKFLPAKSLLRFRSVSKSWNLTIRDPKFAQLHRTISQNRPGATAYTSILWANRRSSHGRVYYFFNVNPQREAIHELTIDTSEFGLDKLIVSPVVNGLVCLYNGGDALICNITTREIISLPTQPLINAAVHYSLGYDPLNNEFKVLCIWRGVKCMVFTIGKDKEWREVIDPFDSKLCPNFFFKVVDHEGAICWLSWTGSTEMQKFVAFDVREEKIRTSSLPVMPMPETGYRIIVQLVKIGGFIGLCSFMGGSKLFVLEDYRNPVWVERNIQVPEHFGVIGSVENKVIFHDGACNGFSFDPINGEVLPFEISGFDHVIQESRGRGEFIAKASICEIVENIYPLRQN